MIEYVPLLAGLLIVAWVLAWRARPGMQPAVERWLRGRAAPAVFGVLPALAAAWVWGGVRVVPVFHDEASYLLQARIFASGRWASPPPPVPEFFEQFHVLVTPVVTSKYPPGHALLMAPGAAIGLPGLVPLLLAGLAGMLLYLLARRAAGVWIAFLAWLLWMAAPANLAWRASYLSENTSSAACLLALWLWVRWRDTGAARWLAATAVAVGWCAITRPLTALLFALPLGALTLAEVVRRRRWRSLAAGLAAGVATLAIIPLWSARTTGDWRVSPWEAYTRAYMDYDRLGFGLQMRPPTRMLPPDVAQVNRGYQKGHRGHVAGQLPAIALSRAGELAKAVALWHALELPTVPEVAYAAMVVLVVAMAWGAAAGPPGARFAGATVAAMFLGYLVYAHPPAWTLYYVELYPGLAFLAAVGLLRMLGMAARALKRQDVPRWTSRAALLAAGVAAIAAVGNAAVARDDARTRQRAPRAFAAAMRRVPDPRALVFVRYAPRHSPHQSLVQNGPDVARARLALAYDRGADDARLIRAMPGRSVYLYDEATSTLRRLTAADLAHPTPAWEAPGAAR
ncbi:MAG: glycosyltransferase family 39 protein [Longimicrobiaceae bacterium]